MTEYITKEEFGVELYEAVVTIGRILGVQNKARIATQKGHVYIARAAEKEGLSLRVELHKQMDALSDTDAAEIVRRYPWVIQ